MKNAAERHEKLLDSRGVPWRSFWRLLAVNSSLPIRSVAVAQGCCCVFIRLHGNAPFG
jgi:hypothetical protein